MRIAVMGCKSYPPGKFAGGIETYVLETIQRMKAQFDFQVLTMEGQGSGVHTVPYLPTRITRTPSYNFFSMMNLGKISPDLIHAHESWAGLWAAFRPDKKVPVLLTMHALDSLQPEWKMFKLPFSMIERSALAVADRVLVPSEYTRLQLVQYRGLAYEKCEVLPNGVDVKKYQSKKKPKDFSILFSGRLTESKNLFSLLEAMRRLPDFKLKVAGTGPIEGQLKKVAPKNVEFLGFRKDIPNLLADAELFVLPSFSEGSPFSVLEAMAAGKAVVASGVGGVPEMVVDTGVLTGTDVNSIVDGIIEAKSNAKKFGEMAQRRAQGFDWEIICKKLAKIYEGMV